MMSLLACQSDYERTLERELDSGVRHDSLFLGIYFGMPASQFYTHCWQLNRDSLIKQGPSNLSVQYMPEGYSSKVYMHFYPNFTPDDRQLIWEMPVLFSYEAWALWNPQFSADTLLPEVLDHFDRMYGGDFLKLEHPDKGEAYVKINGNRRVTVFRKDEQYVQAMITDLLAKDTLEPSATPIL